MKKLLGLLGSKPNPFLFLAPLNGTLAFNDRAGGGTATGSGAVRYQAAPGARTNLFTNPSFETNISSLNAVNCTLSRPTGGTSGSYCARITATANGAFASVHIGGKGLLQAGVTVRVAYDARLVSGSSAYHRIAWYHKRADSAAIGGITIQNLVTLTTDWQRFETTFLLTAVGTHGVILYFYGDGAVSDQVFDLDSIVVEVDAGAGLHYFDGSTGGVWLDPITGILGTAHASPSVSQAVAWVEEGTTNTVPDPSFENATITNYWTAQGTAAISKVTTHAYISSNGGKVVCGAATTDGVHQLATSGAAASSGQSWTVSGRIRAFAAGDVGKTVKAAIIERTSGDAVVTTNLGSAITLTDAWQVFSYTVALSGGGTVAKATCGFMAGAAVAVDFVLDAVQLEQKAYATSYCDGAIGTGYAWAGTAHASSSTRTVTNISVTKTNHINSSRGSFGGKVSRIIDNGISQLVFSAGDYQSVGKDWIGFNVDASDLQKMSATVSNGALQTAGATASTVATWASLYGGWDGTALSASINNATIETGTRTTPIGSFGSSGDLYVGSLTGTLHFNGGISNVAIFDRPLTDRERARIVAIPLLDWLSLEAA